MLVVVVFGVLCVLRHAENTWKDPYVDSDTPPYVHSKRPRVYRQQVHMYKHIIHLLVCILPSSVLWLIHHSCMCLVYSHS